jgi:hypothetical protein
MGEIRRISRGTCEHCEAERERLTRLVLRRPDGIKQLLMVCRYCYIQLRNSRV